MIRIANGQGFWGDWLEAPVRLIEQGPIDYLILDYLAEITMSILQKQKDGDPELGYARDFPPLIGRIAARTGLSSISEAGVQTRKTKFILPPMTSRLTEALGI